MDLIVSVGVAVKVLILKFAGLLIQDATPGLAVIVLLVGLAIASAIYLRRIGARMGALRWLRGIISRTKDEADFSREIREIDGLVGQRRSRATYKSTSVAWSEYRQTLILYGEGDNRILRNSVRPSAFFNIEDLQFGPGFFRIVPGLFVSVGLFLTFLGLIAALGAMHVQGDPDAMRTSLSDLLQAASAKFIMSLTGLLCSIVFTVVLRVGLNRVEREIHRTCQEIEKRLSFLSLEDIAVDQLQAMKEQREHFRTIGMELVAEIARPLREDLPRAISDAISQAIAPAMQQVQQAGTVGVGTMIEDLSSRFSSDVGNALATASKSLEAAGDRIAAMSERMDSSSGTMNREVEETILRVGATIDSIRGGLTDSADQTRAAFTEGTEKLLSVMSETLQDIRANTGESARAVGEAAKDMRAAAQSFREELTEATRSGAQAVAGDMADVSAAATGAVQQASTDLLLAFGKSAGDIAELGQSLAGKFSSDVLGPIDELSGRLGELNQKIAVNNDEMRKLSEGVRSGALASETAATTFRAASGDLVSAANPIKGFVDRMSQAVGDLKAATEATSENLIRNSATMVQSADSVLQSASALLGGEQKAVEAALVGVQEAVTRMKDQGERLDDIDSKLEAAFRTYGEQVTSAMDLMVEHVRKMQGEFGPALDTMRDIVDQAEKFVPSSRSSR